MQDYYDIIECEGVEVYPDTFGNREKSRAEVPTYDVWVDGNGFGGLDYAFTMIGYVQWVYGNAIVTITLGEDAELFTREEAEEVRNLIIKAGIKFAKNSH